MSPSGEERSASFATHVGPFARQDFLRVLHAHWGAGELLEVAEGPSAAMAELVDGVVTGVGHRDLVDYRSPLGDAGVDLLADLVGERPFRFDSMPAEVADALAGTLRSRGRDVVVERRDATAVLRLPPTYDDWLASLGRKERHETRRKRRRYEDLVGAPTIERFEGVGGPFDEFVALHRASAGEKGLFMTGAMVAFFADLLALPGWGIDGLLTASGSLAAAGFGYHGSDGYYLYNSAFDPALREGSPGVVLMASLIESAIGAGREVFDFLKGDEAYKYRLGATARGLFEVGTP